MMKVTKTGIARERVRKEYMKNKEQGAGPYGYMDCYGYADTDSISSYPRMKEAERDRVWEKVKDKSGFSLTIHGPFFDIELDDLSLDEFWEIITAYCREMEEEDGEE